MEAFAKAHAVYAFDLMGHGQSAKPDLDYTIEDFGRNILEAMDRLGIGQAHLVGNSIGALIALEIAAGHPERVRRLVLVGCPAWTPAEKQERQALTAPSFDEKGYPKPRAMSDISLTFAKPNQALLDWVNANRAQAGLWVKRGMEAVLKYDVFPKLGLVKAPTLVVWGEIDQLKSGDQALVSGIKGVQSVTLKDAGHLPQMDGPAAFSKAVLDFLR